MLRVECLTQSASAAVPRPGVLPRQCTLPLHPARPGLPFSVARPLSLKCRQLVLPLTLGTSPRDDVGMTSSVICQAGLRQKNDRFAFAELERPDQWESVLGATLLLLSAAATSAPAALADDVADVAKTAGDTAEVATSAVNTTAAAAAEAAAEAAAKASASAAEAAAAAGSDAATASSAVEVAAERAAAAANDAASAAAEAAAEVARNVPEWFGQAVLLIPVVAYGAFYYLRAKFNPRAGILDFLFIFAATVIVANLITSIFLRVRLY